MRKRRLWPAAGLALVLLLSVREYFDPFLILFIDDILFPKPAPLTARLSEAVIFKLYSDTRPHIGKIDLLQKGLVLLYRGEPLIEEGYGFGLPIIVRNNQPYNARHAEVAQLDANTLVKRYTIDTADRWSKFLQVKYELTPPLGVVVVTYTLRPPDTIAVAVDFAELTAEWDAAFVMNEQGARAFPIYEDAGGRQRHGDDIGIWHAKEGEDSLADFGCWLHRDGGLRFCVETEPGRRRFIGRERYNQYNWAAIYTLSWSGIDIELEPVAVYTYTLRVEIMDEP